MMTSGDKAGFVPYKITICGLDELADNSGRGVTHVLSILDPGHPDPEDFGAYGELNRLELRFDDVIDPVPGKMPPGRQEIEAILRFGRDLAATPGACLLVHCHAGVSRSTAATALILAQAQPQTPASEIIAEVARIRSKAWPNLLMIELGDAMLGRDGTLIAAAHERYAAVGSRLPGVVRFMDEAGRSRELRNLKR